MMNPEDRQVADEAIAELKRLQSCNIEVVMEGLKRLGDQVGPQEKTDDGKERHDAWIAICTLLHSLKGNPSAPVDHLWQKGSWQDLHLASGF
jgi:hypothetical protein